MQSVPIYQMTLDLEIGDSDAVAKHLTQHHSPLTYSPLTKSPLTKKATTL
jgi:hypothetical protein